MKRIITICIAISISASAGVYPEGMVAYWRFDEGVGTIASDSVGTGDGTIVGASWDTGMVGNALRFSEGNYVSTAFHPLISIGVGSSYTKTFWMNQGADTGKQDIIGTGSAPRFYFVNEGSYQYRVGLGNQYTTPFTLPVHPVNTWTHVTVVYDSVLNEIKIYQNGNPNSIITHSYTGDGALDRNVIFSQKDVSWYSFTGLLDEIAIYNRVLSAEEIRQHYEIGLLGLGYDDIPKVSIYTAVEIGWTSVSGLAYQVQYSTNLASTNWFDLGDSIIATNEVNYVFGSTRGTSERFYRVINE